MKILIIGGDSRIAKRLIPKLSNHDVIKTTRRGEGLRLNLTDQSGEFLGVYDCVVVLACDFKKGRPDEEQFELWETNVTGIKKALMRCTYNHVVFASSYLADTDTSYGRQKKAIENWLSKKDQDHSIIRIKRLETEEDYEEAAEEICELVLSR